VISCITFVIPKRFRVQVVANKCYTNLRLLYFYPAEAGVGADAQFSDPRGMHG